MKKMTMDFIIILCLMCVLPLKVFAGVVSSDCKFNGKKLTGKVQIVEAQADVTVQVVHDFPDLKVQRVLTLAQECGQWQKVDTLPDLKIQFVEGSPDIRIRYVESSPGL